MVTTHDADARHEPPASAAPPSNLYKTKSDEVLHQLAIDWLAGLITSDRSLGSADALRTTFLCLTMMAPEQARNLFAALGPKAMIYEHHSKAGPLAVNNQPTFLSFQVLDTDDFERFSAKAQELGAALEGSDAK